MGNGCLVMPDNHFCFLLLSYAYNGFAMPFLLLSYAYNGFAMPFLLPSYAYNGFATPFMLLSYAYNGFATLFILLSYAYNGFAMPFMLPLQASKRYFQVPSHGVGGIRRGRSEIGKFAIYKNMYIFAAH